MAANESDIGRLVVSVEVRTKAMEKQLAKLVSQAGDAANKVSKSWSDADKSMGAANQNAQKLTTTIGNQRAAAANLGFQLQDISQGLMSGTSPFVLMTQQGGQVVQALQQAGGGIQGLMSTLGTAVSSLLNPTALATYALIYLGSTAVQYFTAAADGGEAAAKQLEKESKLLDELAQKYGALLPAVTALANARSAAEDMAKVKEATELAIAESYKELAPVLARLHEGMTEVNADLARGTGATQEQKDNIREYGDALAAVDKAFEDHQLTTAEIERLYVAIGNVIDENNSKYADMRTAINEAFIIARKQAKEDSEARLAAGRATDAAIEKQKKYKEAMDALNKATIPAMSSIEQLWKNYAEAIANATTEMERHEAQLRLTQGLAMESDKATAAVAASGDEIEQYVRDVIRAESSGDPNAKNPLSSARGAGQFVTGTWMRVFKTYFADQAKGMSDAAILALRTDLATNEKMIRAYASENAEALRNAGQDVTQANLHLAHFLGAAGAAAVLKAAPGTKIANIPTITQGAIDANKQILGGGATREDVLAYAANRSGQTRTELSERTKLYKEEAAAAKKAAAEEAAAAKKKAADDARAQANMLEYLASLDAEASLKERITAIEASGLSADDKTRAIAVETELQKALNTAKQNGLNLTKEQIAQAREDAIRIANAGIQSKDLKDKAQEESKAAADALKEAQKAAEDFQKATQQALSGLIKDLISGKDASEAFGDALGKLADAALNIGLNALFSMGGPGAKGGILGGMIIPGIFHKGGLVGRDGHGHGRAVSASTFAGAKRYHQGGMAGLNPGEVPAILKRGEYVVPNLGKSYGGSKGGKQELNIVLQDDSGRMAQIADQQVAMRAGGIVRVSVAQANKTAPAAVAKTQRESAGSEYRI